MTATLRGGVVPQWTASCELHVDPCRFDRVAKNLELYGSELFGDEYDEDAEPDRRDPRKIARERVQEDRRPEPPSAGRGGRRRRPPRRENG